MIETNRDTVKLSLVEQGREFLEQGDLTAAVECYGQAFDPESLDEQEARNMLIEARSHLSKKHLPEALESFEEALVMGTEIQRRQALDGVLTIGRIRARLPRLAAQLKRGLRERFGKKDITSFGLALISEHENLVLISAEAGGLLPGYLTKGGRIGRIPHRISEYRLPFATDKCIAFAEEDDIRYVLEIADTLNVRHDTKRNS
jgi:tetratricopeptide (TPR) repeat protein